VVYSDEFHLWMYDGQTGNNLIPKLCNTTGTLWEYPVIADVDNDGHADIVVASNGYAFTCPDNGSQQSGIQIYSSASNSWVRSRRVWNQHTYHVTNVGEDGSVPAKEVPNWKQPGLNNFRQNKQPGSEFAAPNAQVTVTPRCSGADYALAATVRNVGQSVLPAGVVVQFYEGDPPTGSLLGSASTSYDLAPLQSETVVLKLAMMPSSPHVFATLSTQAKQCKTDDDTSPPTNTACGIQ